MRILLVRHGETDFNKKGIMQGQTSPEIPLNKNGEKQVEKTAKFLKNNFKGKIKRIFSSPLKRAIQTATPIAKSLEINKIIVDPRLKEKHHGIYDGKHHFVFRKAAMNFPYHEYRPPNGENYYDVIERVANFFKDNLQNNFLIVSHGAVTKSIISYLCNINIKDLFEIDIENCSVVKIEGKSKLNYKIIK